MSEKEVTCINCALCGKKDVMMLLHFTPKADTGELKCPKHPVNDNGDPMSPPDALAKYKTMYPHCETISKEAMGVLLKKQEREEEEQRIAMATAAVTAEPASEPSDGDTSATVTPIYGYTASTEYRTERAALNEILGLPSGSLTNAMGNPIVTDVFLNRPFPEFVPEVNKSYMFSDTELIKDVLMCFTTGMPAYLWGHAGTGKSSMPTQLAARLNRPIMRAQHTASTEESHITGQILAKGGRTYFEPGLLTMAMKHGIIYLADEYDFAYPQILSLYQPVLENEPLILKEATPEWRRTTPHKHFAFVATGNTNGSGDETGLYQGTNQQNAANFSRFALVTKVEYMPEDQEIEILKSNGIPEAMSRLYVKFATRCREAFEAHEISQPIGPRELILAGKIGVMRQNPMLGLMKAYINKLPSASAHAVTEFAQRIFGTAA